MSDPDNGVSVSPAEADQALSDGDQLIHRIINQMQEIDQQTHALSGSFSGNVHDTHQSAHSNFQQSMDDVTRTGKQLINAAQDAVSRIHGADQH
jgi:uncharacterized protein YukE